MAGALDYAVWFLCVCSLGNVMPVDSSHFMGGIIKWRPVDPAEFDGLVEITHRIAWRRSSTEGTCTQASIDAQTLRPINSFLTCQSGCVGNIGNFSYYCNDFSITDNWSAGERTYTYNFTESSFEAMFATCCWISLISGGSADWELRVRGNLTYREDSGLINSSPIVNMPPLIHVQWGCNHIIKIPVEDADGDYVRCRWAESYLNECGEVCRSFSTNLNGRACEIQYTGSVNLATGDYAVALQVEDFMSPTDTTPLSSVPVQFVVRVQAFASSPCTSKPEFVGVTPLNGSYFKVPFNTSWNATIIARVSDNSTATSITEFVTASPLGMKRSNLVQSGNCPGEWQVDVTWIPVELQFGPNIFCYAALDDIGLQSAQRCVTLFVCMEPPTTVPDSLFPRGKTFFNQSLWLMSVQFDKQFTRPTRDTYIRIFGEQGDEMVSINVRTSASVTYPSDTLGHTLTFSINICQLPVNHTLYILLDAGVAISTESCHAESPPMSDPTQWTFIIAEHTKSYNIMQEFVTTENTETLEFTTSEHTNMQELVTAEHTDTHGQESFTSTTSGSNTENKTESLRNSSIITITLSICTIFAFVVGVICGLIANCCVCVLLKRKVKRQSTASSYIERSGKTVNCDKDLNASNKVDAVYDEIIPHYYEPGIPGTFQMKHNESVAH